MTTELLPARLQPAQRKPTGASVSTDARVRTWAAPLKGLVADQPRAAPDAWSASHLENFWPLASGLAPRGGLTLMGTLASSEPVRSIFGHGGGGQVFAASDTAIHDLTIDEPASEPLQPRAEFSTASANQPRLTPTSGNYSSLSIRNDGGTFLICANGTDPVLIFNGTRFEAMGDGAVPDQTWNLTGVESHRLSHLWVHQKRLFAIEGGTANAWYLPPDALSGTATKLPLAGVFQKGGNLTFGSSWSSDSGAGIDDRCVFVSERGEAAVYAGINPASINTWQLVGVFDVGAPVGRFAHVTIGGDLVMATRDGLIPISAAVAKDPGQLRLAALSRPIGPMWRAAISRLPLGWSDAWRFVKWPERQMAIVAPMGNTGTAWQGFVVNMGTNAWGTLTGWAPTTMAVVHGKLLIGDQKGRIFTCDEGGKDDGKPIMSRVRFAFDDLGAPGRLKSAGALRARWRTRSSIIPRHSLASDYRETFPPLPMSARGNRVRESARSTWDVSAWDVSAWVGFTKFRVLERWQSVSGMGEVLAVEVQLPSTGQASLDCELISVDLSYRVGAAVA